MRREGSALRGVGVVMLKELADHFTSVLDKDEQDIECTAAKFDRLVGFLQNALGGIQSKRPEGDNLLGMLAACLKHRLQRQSHRRRKMLNHSCGGIGGQRIWRTSPSTR